MVQHSATVGPEVGKVGKVIWHKNDVGDTAAARCQTFFLDSLVRDDLIANMRNIITNINHSPGLQTNTFLLV